MQCFLKFKRSKVQEFSAHLHESSRQKTLQNSLSEIQAFKICARPPPPLSPSLDHPFVTQLPREPSTAFELPRVFPLKSFFQCGGTALWQRTTFYCIWCLYCKQSETFRCRQGNVDKLMNSMKCVGVFSQVFRVFSHYISGCGMQLFPQCVVKDLWPPPNQPPTQHKA